MTQLQCEERNPSRETKGLAALETFINLIAEQEAEVNLLPDEKAVQDQLACYCGRSRYSTELTKSFITLQHR